ncbi:zinc finger MYM-type protein 1-like [Sitophilus oryzae]|uniref:Zinc finger MYM-type protein 1-like n=1 Tax=Sitophilus oryzae TaxID=7048 RepID=A0A6J2XEZ5_SITOR|nr:zinc finger MYM-type protein 1-like [Sitophilus oryzae]
MAKRNVQSSLTDFFCKKSKISSESIEEAASSSQAICTDTPTLEVAPNCIQTLIEVNTRNQTKFDNSDIGCCFTEKLDDGVKFRLLTSPWVPDEKYNFPVSKKRNLKFQIGWLKRFPWPSYNNHGDQGAVCKYCAIFASEFNGKGSHQKLFSLVVKPFNNWKDAIETFVHHSNTDYHKKSTVFADNFVATFNRSAPDIVMQLDSSRAKQIADNRKKLKPIIETIILCGRQELALRGTNDSGPLTLNSIEPVYNDGNFRALLRMRLSCGDKDLIEHIEGQSLNAMYISPIIQNNIIQICGKMIQEQIVSRINKSKYFSILMDETTDISRIEQLSLCVRYIDSNEQNGNPVYIMREDFLQFVQVHSTTGNDLATVMLECLEELKIDCTYLVGQGYDGAAAMSGSFKGVQAIIREKHPAALYVHCSAHSLNLALAHCCNVQSVRNCIGTIKSVAIFIKMSAKRTDILQNKIKEHAPDNKWKKLTTMCETRWVENHDGLIRFTEIFKPLVETLEELQVVKDIETSSKATQLHHAIMTGDFIISMLTATTLFAYTLPLCRILQTVNIDLFSATEHVDTVLSQLKSMRDNIDQVFSNIFEKAKKQ